MKIFIFVLGFLPIFVFADPAIYQAGTLINLMNGVYTGSTTFAQLAKEGDFGLGTGNGLDGEMVAINDKFYLADINGNTREVPPSETTPFAMVIEFKPQQHFTLSDIHNIAQFEREMAAHLPSANLFYVMRVDATFSNIEARSELPAQKPYLPLAADMKKNQRIYYFHHIKGSLIIFKSPQFFNSITVPGYHIHFISADRKKAGHVFNFSIKNAKVSVEQVRKFTLALPTSKAYEQAVFKSSSSNASVKKIENRS